jgi:hypothetical protein
LRRLAGVLPAAEILSALREGSLAFDLGWRLAGWFARSSRGVCLSRIVSPGSGAGTRLQSGAKNFCNEID